jgi:hypothetical protein
MTAVDVNGRMGNVVSLEPSGSPPGCSGSIKLNTAESEEHE